MNVIFTKTFDRTLHRAVDFLLVNSGFTEEEAIERVTKTIQSFEDRMTDQPLSCQLCRETEKLGVMTFREYHRDDYRVIYMTTNSEVMALLFLHQRQSIQKALVDHCLSI